MVLMESGEMYLENILILSNELSAVHSIDVSQRMGFSKPSVSRAIKILKENGYINVDPYGAITLTDSGRSLAERIYERHTALTKALMLLGVDEETAQDDACRMEHYISEKTFSAIKKHLEQMQ